MAYAAGMDCGSIDGSDRGTARLVEFCMKKLYWIDSEVQGPIRYVRYGSVTDVRQSIEPSSLVGLVPGADAKVLGGHRSKSPY
jgi:hypothetical protein